MKTLYKYCLLALVSATTAGLTLSCPVFAASDSAPTTDSGQEPKAVPIPDTAPTKDKDSDSSNLSFGDYLSGRMAEASGDSGKSVKYLQESLKHAPANTDIMLNLYHVLVAANNIDDAVPIAKKLYEAKVADDGDQFPPAFILALDAVKHENFKDAQDYLKAIPKAGFNSLLVPLIDAWLKLGNNTIKAGITAKDIMPNKMLLPHIYVNAGFIDEIAGFEPQALEQYETAAHETRLESSRAAEALANYYIRKGKKEAFEEFVKAYKSTHGETVIDEEIYSKQPPAALVTNVKEGVAEALYTVTSIFHGLRTPSEEITTLNIALYLRPDFSAAHFLLAGAYELSHSYDLAIKSYQTIPPESAYYTQSLIMIAYDENELGSKEAAIADLDKIASAKPQAISALLAKGDILRANNNYEQAIAVYDEAVTRIKTPQRTNWLIYFSRAICNDRLGKFDKTEEDMKKALEVSPNEPDVLNYLGYSWLTKRHNVTEAKKMIEKAYEARPEDAEIIDSMGYALYIDGDFASAQEYFEQALERIPNDPTVNEHLGDAYFQQGHKVEANYQWRRALEDKPDEENKKALLDKLKNGVELITPAPAPTTSGDKKPKSPEV